MHTEFSGGDLREEAGLIVKKIVTCKKAQLGCNGITVTSTLVEMLEYKQPV